MNRANKPIGRIRPLNRPRPVRVDTNEHGLPARVRVRDRWKRVEAVLEMWRIDDEWWREPISRAYYTLLLEGGRHLTIYEDLVDGRWCFQPE